MNIPADTRIEHLKYSTVNIPAVTHTEHLKSSSLKTLKDTPFEPLQKLALSYGEHLAVTKIKHVEDIGNVPKQDTPPQRGTQTQYLGGTRTEHLRNSKTERTRDL